MVLEAWHIEGKKDTMFNGRQWDRVLIGRLEFRSEAVVRTLVLGGVDLHVALDNVKRRHGRMRQPCPATKALLENIFQKANNIQKYQRTAGEDAANGASPVELGCMAGK